MVARRMMPMFEVLDAGQIHGYDVRTPPPWEGIRIRPAKQSEKQRFLWKTVKTHSAV